VGHDEDARLLARSEAILGRSEESEAAAAFTIERQHCIHEVLERLGPGDRALFGDVADEHDRAAGALGVANEARGTLSDLRDGPGRSLEPGVLEALYRVDRKSVV
jgi:hypothetical protein